MCVCTCIRMHCIYMSSPPIMSLLVLFHRRETCLRIPQSIGALPDGQRGRCWPQVEAPSGWEMLGTINIHKHLHIYIYINIYKLFMWKKNAPAPNLNCDDHQWILDVY